MQTAEACRENLSFPVFVEALNKDGIKVRPLKDEELAYLLKTKGQPPVDPPYTVSIVETDENSMLVIVKADCIVGKLGPLPTFLMQGIIGQTEAQVN